MKQVLKYFMQGLIYVVPVTVTLYVIWETFLLLDNIIPVNIPGLGLVIAFAFITLAGVLANHIISDRIIAMIERQLRRAPLINLIYTAVKDLMQAFVGEKKSFSKPVLVKFMENSELRRLGFVTNNNFEKLSETCDLITVYIPHSYNISGNTFLLPAQYVQPLDANASEIMKYVVSGGVTELSRLGLADPDELPRQEQEPDKEPPTPGTS